MKNKIYKVLFKIFKEIKKYKERYIGEGIGGKIPIVAKIYFSLYKILNPKSIVLVKTKESNMMYVDSRDIGIGQTLVMGNAYEKFEAELFKKAVKPGMTVIDIGTTGDIIHCLLQNSLEKKEKSMPLNRNHIIIIC